MSMNKAPKLESSRILLKSRQAGQPDLAKEWVSRLRAAGCEHSPKGPGGGGGRVTE